MTTNAPWRDALAVLVLFGVFVTGALIANQCRGDGETAPPKGDSAGDFGMRAALFDKVQYTATYFLTPFSKPNVPINVPVRERTPGSTPTARPVAEPLGPPITVVWYHDGSKHNRFTFREINDTGALDVLEDEDTVTLCSSRA